MVYAGSQATYDLETAILFEDGGYGLDKGLMTGYSYIRGRWVFKFPNFMGGHLSFSLTSRYTGVIDVPQGNEFGPQLDRGATFRASVFGPSAQAAFVVPAYTYYYTGYVAGAAVEHTTCGGSQLVGDMLAAEPIVLGQKYNFLGWIK